MEVTALGMIETVGLVSAIEAADAGLKAADVRLLGTDYVRGGLVMVRFEGDVAAVQAAVDAGTLAAQRIGKVFAAHVIPRAMPEVFCMLASDVGEGPSRRAQDGCAQCGGCEGGRLACAIKPKTAQTEAKPARSRSTGSVKPDAEQPDAGTAPVTPQELSGWKVVQLRTYVRGLPDFPLAPNEIRYATKQALLDALAAYRIKGE